MRHTARTVVLTIATLFGLYLIGRAVAEPWVIDLSDPSTYRNDWGGPHLAGVLAVHCGPGVVSIALMAATLRRRVSPRRLIGLHR